MHTEIEKVTGDMEQDAAVFRKAGDILLAGGLVAFPTETVYGLGGDALQSVSSRKIYAAKGRPSDNPLIVHIADLSSVEHITKNMPQTAYQLAKAFWPGPLTMILQKNEKVPYETTGGMDTVAIRMPNHKVALQLIRAGGGYIAAPSANTSGRPSPTKASHVYEDLAGKIDLILDGGDVKIGVESTIIDLTEDIPMILRPGYITQKMLSKVIGTVRTDPGIIASDSIKKPKAPGMKYRHYAPKANLVIVEGETSAVINKINACAQSDEVSGKKVGIIATEETVQKYRYGQIISIGTRSDETTIAQHLYGVLREFDASGVEQIYSESFYMPQMGEAIMNRLLKAAGHHVMKA